MTGPEDLGRLVENLIQQLQAAQVTQANMAGIQLIQTIAHQSLATKKTPKEIVALYNECAAALKDMKVR